MARVAEESKKENCEVYAQKPYYDSSQSRDLTSLKIMAHPVMRKICPESMVLRT